MCSCTVPFSFPNSRKKTHLNASRRFANPLTLSYGAPTNSVTKSSLPSTASWTVPSQNPLLPMKSFSSFSADAMPGVTLTGGTNFAFLCPVLVAHMSLSLVFLPNPSAWARATAPVTLSCQPFLPESIPRPSLLSGKMLASPARILLLTLPKT